MDIRERQQHLKRQSNDLMKYRVDYNNPLNMGETLCELAQFYIKRGKLDKAIENLQTALAYFKLVPAEQKIAEVEKTIAAFSYKDGEVYN